MTSNPFRPEYTCEQLFHVWTTKGFLKTNTVRALPGPVFVELAYSNVKSALSPRLPAASLFRPMQRSDATLALTTRTQAMDYLSIGPHNGITELEDELPCKASETSGVCVRLNPIYVFNGSRPGAYVTEHRRALDSKPTANI